MPRSQRDWTPGKGGVWQRVHQLVIALRCKGSKKFRAAKSELIRPRLELGALSVLRTRDNQLHHPTAMTQEYVNEDIFDFKTCHYSAFAVATVNATNIIV